MNLIEQLGGYDRAINIANCKSGVVHPTKQPLDALLQYRRENNIFEEGDLVVIPSKVGDLFTVNRLLSRSDRDEMVHATDAEIKAGHRLELEILNDHDIPHNTTIMEK